MAITASGIGSGLDINSIVSQLMTLERRPVSLLQARSQTFETQLSAFGRLRSAVSTFQTAMEDLGSLDKFKVFTAASSDEDIMTASGDSDAAAGIYEVDVTRLAQNHKMGSNEIASADEFTGNLQITIDGESQTVDTAGLTMEGIRDAINDDENNPGVTATILNVGGGNQRLVLTANEAGQANSLSITDSTTNVTSGTALNFTTNNRDNLGALITTAELDAVYSVDGYSLTSSSNNVSGVVDGLTLNLKDVGSSTLTVTRDAEKIEEAAQTFVDAYNALQSTVSALSDGDLSGDSTLRSIQGQLRDVLNTAPTGLTGTFSALSQIGISSDPKTGTLIYNSSEFVDAMEFDFQSVAELFANDDQGVAFRFAGLADSLLDKDNIIDAREDGLQARIDSTEDSILAGERRLELKEVALRSQYASLDTLLGGLQSTSSFLAAQLG